MNTTAPPYAVGLAPMEGVTGFPARLFFRLASRPATIATPFLRVTATHPHKALPPEFVPEITALGGRGTDYPLVVQLMAVEGDDFLRAAELFMEHVPFLEINCGCPSPTCVGKGAGSSMLKDQDDFHATMARISKALGPKRFAVKMRTGFDAHAEFPGLVAGLAELDLARLTVHGRTRPEGYKGKARWDLIAQAARSARAPVIASGDVVSHAALSGMRTVAPATHGALIGRGALRNPWVFEEIRTLSPVTMPAAALRAALVTFALLHELARAGVARLVHAVERGLLASTCGNDAGRWEAAADLLAREITGEPWPHRQRAREEDFPFERHTIGRLKLLWSYLRSSLPPSFFAPETLRAKTVGDLLARFDALVAAHGGESLVLAHDAAHDWIYAGSKKS